MCFWTIIFSVMFIKKLIVLVQQIMMRLLIVTFWFTKIQIIDFLTPHFISMGRLGCSPGRKLSWFRFIYRWENITRINLIRVSWVRYFKSGGNGKGKSPLVSIVGTGFLFFFEMCNLLNQTIQYLIVWYFSFN